jgi:hypothetical protein
MATRHAHAYAGWPPEDVELFVRPRDRSGLAGGVLWALRQSSRELSTKTQGGAWTRINCPWGYRFAVSPTRWSWLAFSSAHVRL